MEHDLELISPILEIVDRTIHIQSYPVNIGSYETPAAPVPAVPEPAPAGEAVRLRSI